MKKLFEVFCWNWESTPPGRVYFHEAVTGTDAEDAKQRALAWHPGAAKRMADGEEIEFLVREVLIEAELSETQVGEAPSPVTPEVPAPVQSPPKPRGRPPKKKWGRG